MLYELLYPLSEKYFIFNVFQYLTFRAAGAAITSLLISFFIGPKIIRTLKFRQIGEKIYNGPESHQKKEGTPTMGGIILLLSIILPSILWCRLDNEFFQHISTFKGASNRLELVKRKEDSLIYKDFAHSPSKLKATAD